MESAVLVQTIVLAAQVAAIASRATTLSYFTTINV